MLQMQDFSKNTAALTTCCFNIHFVPVEGNNKGQENPQRRWQEEDRHENSQNNSLEWD